MTHRIQVKLFFYLILFAFSNRICSQEFITIGNAYSINAIDSETCGTVGQCFTLTEAINSQIGAVWDMNTISLSQNFDASFCVYLGAIDDGADGIAFVMRAPGSNAIGGEGLGLGYGTNNGTQGIFPSVAIEFDTFYNEGMFDIPQDHTQVVINAEVTQAPAVAAIPLMPNGANVENGNFHTARIVWNSDNNTLQLFFNGNLRFTYQNDLVNTVFGGNPEIIWGFTASTGGMNNLQQICFPQINIDIPDQIICETDSALVSYYYHNLTFYEWIDPNNETIISWNENSGTPLTDTSFYATIEGTYTINVEYNNQFYSGTTNVSFINGPYNIDLEICSESINLLEYLTGAPSDGNWSGPSNLSNGVQGTFSSEINTFGSYRYTSPTFSSCPIDYYEVTLSPIEVSVNPTIQLVPCSSTTYEIEVNPELSVGGSNFTYTWLSEGNILSSSGNTATVTISENANLTLLLSSTDIISCFHDTIFELDFIANPQLNLGEDLTICENESIELSSNGIWLSYLWNTGSTNPSITAQNEGFYWCEVEVENGCTLRDSIYLTIFSLPSINLTQDSYSGCPNDVLTFDALVSPQNSIVNWVFSDGFPFSNTTNITKSFAQSGFYDIEISAISTEGCGNTIVFYDYIEIYQQPQANFTYEIISSNLNSHEFQLINTSLNYSNELWIFNGLDSISGPNPNYSYDENSENFIALIVNNEYCRDSTTRKIVVQEEAVYYVPNSFTPNGDNFNNVFSPVISGGIKLDSYHLIIYNRWGNIVFESYNSKYGWDGSFDNQIVQNGIYVWQISFEELSSGAKKTIHGHVNVIN
jgi:gliding motility-associated-like protein